MTGCWKKEWATMKRYGNIWYTTGIRLVLDNKYLMKIIEDAIDEETSM